MSQNAVRPQIYGAEFLECAYLVGKVMIERNGDFSEHEIDIASALLSSDIEWPGPIRNFLAVIAGSAHPNVGLFDECYAALIDPRKE